MFGGHISSCRASFLEERSDLTIDGLAGDHVFNWFLVVLEDGKQTFLDETSIDPVAILYEQFQPPWKEDFVILKILNSVLN